MSDIEWRDGTLPISKHFDDPYYSREDGRAETAHVFIAGNNLPQRWNKSEHFTIAELGFGTGLNFLETVYQWQALADVTARLNFISFEAFPLKAEDARTALSSWPELEILANRLLDFWHWNGKGLQIDFAPNIHLRVFEGDANQTLPAQNLNADAWYLDGFSPAKNPELWNENLIHEVGRNTRTGGTFATYTSAGFVRRNLQAAGFEVSKVPGFGRKREMLAGIKHAT